VTFSRHVIAEKLLGVKQHSLNHSLARSPGNPVISTYI